MTRVLHQLSQFWIKKIHRLWYQKCSFHFDSSIRRKSEGILIWILINREVTPSKRHQESHSTLMQNVISSMNSLCLLYYLDNDNTHSPFFYDTPSFILQNILDFRYVWYLKSTCLFLVINIANVYFRVSFSLYSFFWIRRWWEWSHIWSIHCSSKWAWNQTRSQNKKPSMYFIVDSDQYCNFPIFSNLYKREVIFPRKCYFEIRDSW